MLIIDEGSTLQHIKNEIRWNEQVNRFKSKQALSDVLKVANSLA